MTKDGPPPRKILGNLSHPSLDPVPPMNFRNFPNFPCWLAVPPISPPRKISQSVPVQNFSTCRGMCHPQKNSSNRRFSNFFSALTKILFYHICLNDDHFFSSNESRMTYFFRFFGYFPVDCHLCHSFTIFRQISRSIQKISIELWLLFHVFFSDIWLRLDHLPSASQIFHQIIL